MTKRIRISKELVDNAKVTIESDDTEYHIIFHGADYLTYLNQAETIMASHFGNKPDMAGIQNTICDEIIYLYYTWRKAVEKLKGIEPKENIVPL